MNKKQNRGFTLIELLVVIAIIGILSSVVLASLNSARQKSRDARRIADIKQIQTALELFYDAQATPGYPATLATAGFGGTYIPVVPNDPINNATYFYSYYSLAAANGGTPCTGYHLMARLETNNPALNNDADAAPSGLLCSGSATPDIIGTDGTGPYLYDVKP